MQLTDAVFILTPYNVLPRVACLLWLRSALALLFIFWVLSFDLPMLTRRPCHDCGREVRLSSSIQPPRCPACRLAQFPPPPVIWPCLGCRVPLPADSSNPRCSNCQPSDASCLGCGNIFPARLGVTRCFGCRPRPSRVAQAPTDFGILFNTTFNPFINSLQSRPPAHESPPSQGQPIRRIERTVEASGSSFAIDQGLDFLRQEHASRVRASDVFPPEISSSVKREAVSRFHKNMALAARDTTCCSCGMLVALSDISRFLPGDSLLRPLEGFLDSCGSIDGFWYLCSLCHAALLRGSIPKLSAKNNVNVTLCQHYPNALKDLTLPEEYLIAKSHPVGVVVKLRPGGQASPANYRALRGHFIVIPQDPKPLLRILPDPGLEFTDLIKVF